jgi:hypothetical protein
MLKAMRLHQEAGRWDQAAAVAKDAAPYCHPRLSSIETTMQSDNVHRVISERPMTEEEWLAAFAPKVSVAADDDASSQDIGIHC